MGTRALKLLVGFAACCALAAPAMAQEGHPLTGTWLGEWGPKKTPVFVVLGWNGLDITGAINPGPDAAPIKNATLTGPVGGGGGGRGGGGRGAVTPAAPSVVPVALVIQAPAAPAAGGAGGRGGGGQRGGGGGQRGGGGAAGGGGGAPRGGGGAAPGGGAGAGAAPVAAAGSTDWLVHLEADGKDAKGAAVHYVIDGKIENVGLANRSISGTWSENGQKGDLRMVRQ